MAVQKLSGKQKAAILLVAMGPEFASQIFKHLQDEEIEELTMEIASLRQVQKKDKIRVIREFHENWMAQEFITSGGIDYAREVLEKAVGKKKAMEILNRLTTRLQVRPFEFARKADATQIYNFIQNEHPQTIALVLSYLEPQQAAMVLSTLPEEKQVDVARRIAVMESASPEVVSEVERVLEQRISTMASLEYEEVGGLPSIVAILNGVDRSTERVIMEGLEKEEPGLAEEIKKRMFIFEDIINLDDRSIQRILREVDNQDLLLALRAASDEVKAAIFRNVSSRMRESLEEDLAYMGPVRLREVEEAQTRIVSIVRMLDESNEIVISRGGGDDVLV